MTDEIILEAEDVWYSYEDDGNFALRGLDVRIKKGSRVAFVGANGSGKSTFFLCCNGILRPQKGTIRFHGKPLRYTKKELLSLRAKVGIVFQDPDNQLFSASVRQEISFGILNLGAGETEAAEAVDRVMEEMEITPFQDQPVHALSGGQKKQVSIADVLVMKPEIVILDEPAAALDPKHDRLVKKLLAGLTGQGITVIVSTHDMDYAYSWADEIVLLGGGRALCQGSPQKVCQKKELLAENNLEQPQLLRLSDCLKRHGVIGGDAQPARTWEELEAQLS